MYISDLHIHSRFSRATSRELTPGSLDLWARKKGIHILGTGDFTHPAWRAELKEQLAPAEPGLYLVKKEVRIEAGVRAASASPRFVITGEISSIYKKNGRVRKVHSLIILPSLEAADILSGRLAAIGNIHSDGRPILGLDCHDLLAMTLDACPEAILCPPTSGRPTSPCSGPSPALTPWRNALRSSRPRSTRWKPACPLIPP